MPKKSKIVYDDGKKGKRKRKRKGHPKRKKVNYKIKH